MLDAVLPQEEQKTEITGIEIMMVMEDESQSSLKDIIGKMGHMFVATIEQLLDNNLQL